MQNENKSPIPIFFSIFLNSKFDVGRSMFDVHSFSIYAINRQLRVLGLEGSRGKPLALSYELLAASQLSGVPVSQPPSNN